MSQILRNVRYSGNYRRSHQWRSIKKGVIENYAKFPGKRLCQSLFFNKVAGLRAKTLFKKRLCRLCLPLKFWKTPFLQNTSWRLLLFFIWVFFHGHSQITGLQMKGVRISLTPDYHFHLVHRHLDISEAITPESSFLHIGSSWTRTGKLSM